MTRWHWDWEDDHSSHGGRRSATLHRPRRPRPAEGDEPAAPRSPLSMTPVQRRRAQIRRRRVGAAAAAVLGLIVLIAVLTSSGGGGEGGATAASRHIGAAAPTAAQQPPSTESGAGAQAAVASVLSYTPFIRQGTGAAPDVALTFDDGPGPYTPQVLSVLEHYNVHATFFVIGVMLRYFGAATARAIRDGDVIGDHTETHPMMAKLSAHEQYEQLFEQAARIELLGAPRPTLFRPPYGSFNPTTFKELRHLHQLMVLWSADTGDYLQPGVEAIVQRALASAKPGAIILMHDAGGTRTQTIEALPGIIRGIRAKGLRLVTVPRLLAEDPPPHGQLVPSSLGGD